MCELVNLIHPQVDDWVINCDRHSPHYRKKLQVISVSAFSVVLLAENGLPTYALKKHIAFPDADDVE